MSQQLVLSAAGIAQKALAQTEDLQRALSEIMSHHNPKQEPQWSEMENCASCALDLLRRCHFLLLENSKTEGTSTNRSPTSFLGSIKTESFEGALALSADNLLESAPSTPNCHVSRPDLTIMTSAPSSPPRATRLESLLANALDHASTGGTRGQNQRKASSGAGQKRSCEEGSTSAHGSAQESETLKRARRPVIEDQTCKDLPCDGWEWRKYGVKSIQAQRFPRFYFKCTHILRDRGGEAGHGHECPVKKQADRCPDDPSKWVVRYFGVHDHAKPPPPPVTVTVVMDSSSGGQPCSHDTLSQQAPGEDQGHVAAPGGDATVTNDCNTVHCSTSPHGKSSHNRSSLGTPVPVFGLCLDPKGGHGAAEASREPTTMLPGSFHSDSKEGLVELPAQQGEVAELSLTEDSSSPPTSAHYDGAGGSEAQQEEGSPRGKASGGRDGEGEGPEDLLIDLAGPTGCEMPGVQAGAEEASFREEEASIRVPVKRSVGLWEEWATLGLCLPTPLHGEGVLLGLSSSTGIGTGTPIPRAGSLLISPWTKEHLDRYGF